jgi:excisionase family DNA binding protein
MSSGRNVVLTVKRAAADVGVSQNLIYSLCAAGEIKHLRLGGPGRRGKILIAEEDWTAYLAARKVGGEVPFTPVTETESRPRKQNRPSLKHVKLKASDLPD